MEVDVAEKLGLGSVQFGMPYGVTNRDGMPSADEVAGILEIACAAGIRLVDTATGSKAREAVLGRSWPRSHQFCVVTKTPSMEKAKLSHPMRGT